MDEQQNPAPEAAGDEVVADKAAQTEDQSDDQVDGEQPENDQDGDQSEKDEISPSKARRERRKAEMERLRTEKAEAERRAEEYRQRLEKMSGGNNPAPKREDYQDYDEWQADLAAHKVMSQMSAKERAQIEEQSREHTEALRRAQEAEKRALAESWTDQVEDAKTRYADFEQVAYSAPISDQLAEMIARSEMGADLAYHLGTHRDLAARLSQSDPLTAARELGRLEATLSLPKAPTQTQAPDPVSPVKPKAKAAKDPAKMSMEEYIAARRAGQIR